METYNKQFFNDIYYHLKRDYVRVEINLYASWIRFVFKNKNNWEWNVNGGYENLLSGIKTNDYNFLCDLFKDYLK